jgi:transposase
MPTYAQLAEENVLLREENARLREDSANLRALVAAQEATIAELRKIVELQAARIEELEKEVMRLKRRGKRQAAPFSKGSPKPKPKKPGRKPGKKHGRHAERSTPPRVDKTIRVDCPLFCPHCEAQVRLEDKLSQFQIDLPPIQPWITEFVVERGRCEGCGRRVRGRHPLQVSDALTVGRVHFGPEVITLAAHLNKVCGLSYGKIATLMKSWMGLDVNRSSLCRALQRLSLKGRATYDGLISKVRGSPVVTGDETGWRVGGLGHWLWGFSTTRETVYQIHRGRGFAEASQVLGEDYSGILIADGWAPYRCFGEATLQTCLTHLLRRCSLILDQATRGAVRFPRQVREVLEKALEARDRRDRGEITWRGAQVVRGRLQAKMSRLLGGRFTNAENRRFAKHLRNYADALFVFLKYEGVEATNWRGEHAMRAGIMVRKCCGGGNRTQAGAEVQAILMSLLRTCHQKALDPREVFSEILRAPQLQPNLLLIDG